jgi:uncharacterized membrane protein YbhN (UPF0104 family)
LRTRLVLVSVGLVVLLALALALAPVDLGRAFGYAAINPFGAAMALLAYTGAFALRATSWRPLVGEGVPFARLFSLLMGALFLNHAAPAKSGDFARMYALARRVSAEQAVASVVLSRVVDLVGLLAVLAAALALSAAGGVEGILLPFLAVCGAAVVLFLLARLKVPASFGAISRHAGRLQEALRGTSGMALLTSFVFAAPAWVLEAGMLAFVARGLGLDLSPAELVAATCFAVLVAAVPLTPGSLGTYEAGMVAALLAIGVPAEPAFAAAVMTHAVKFLYALAAAPFALKEGFAAVREREARADETRLEV